MSKVINNKLCIGCNVEIPISDYWLAVRGKHERYHSRCKPCHSITRRENRGPLKKLGFAALDLEAQKDIVQMINDKQKKTVIARKYDIKYTTFMKWCKLGKCVLGEVSRSLTSLENEE